MTYLDYFKEFSKIPHGSTNTKAISDYLYRFGKEHNLETYQDDVNNIIMIKEASKGREQDEPIIIQGHMDMVAVTDDPNKDMQKEGLELVTEGDFLFAKDTTLGADDGIAVAYALDLLADETLSHPRLEVIITVDEEIGMEGADAIDLSMLKGHTLLNLDSEEEGYFLVSCAGGARIDFHYDLCNETVLAPQSGQKIYEIEIKDLIGGHSGTEIHKGRANAIRLMCKLVKKLSDAGFVTGLGSFEGGTADNVICNRCTATILGSNIEPELFDMFKFEVLEKYMGIETEASITLKETTFEDDFYTCKDFLHFLMSLPDGVIKMSPDIEGLTETSLNHGIIHMNRGKISLSLCIRSNIDEEKENLIETLYELTDNHPVTVKTHGEYPGWAYRKDSPLREKMIKTYKEMFGKEPVVMALHAGLECGILAKKISNLDCVSFGPWIYDIHTTKERLSLSSAERMYRFVRELLK